MNTAALISETTDNHGRTLYVVAGMASTYCAALAIELAECEVETVLTTPMVLLDTGEFCVARAVNGHGFL